MSNCTTASVPFCTVTNLCRLLICKLLCIKVSVRCPEDKCYLLRAQGKVSTPTAARLCPGTLRNFARLLITIDCPTVRSDRLKSNQDHTVTFNPACCLCSCVAQLGIPEENSQIDPGRFFFILEIALIVSNSAPQSHFITQVLTLPVAFAQTRFHSPLELLVSHEET